MATIRTIKTLIIGAGFGGIGMAIQLHKKQLGDFLIWEKQPSAGGTWHDNHYPGSACDIPSHLYSFSFFPKANWSRRFAPQAEIETYIQECIQHFNLAQHIEYNKEITKATWREEKHCWQVEAKDGDCIHAQFLISATGQLNIPHIPDIDGLKDFQGLLYHSARWGDTESLRDKNIAVIGTGASAIQFIPELTKIAKSITVFQRSAPYVLPKADRAYSESEKRRFAHYPQWLKLTRLNIWLQAEWRFLAFRYLKPLMHLERWRWQRHMHKIIDDQELREKLTPDYTLGCKRILLADNYYQAMKSPNLHLNTNGISSIDAHGIVDKNGQHFAADALLLGSGFRTTDFLFPMSIQGRNGQDIHQTWQNGAEAYLGSAVHGFPNFFMLYGPNINLGHNSIIYMLECQIDYLCQAIHYAHKHALNQLEVKQDIQAAYNQQLQKNLQKTVWSTGCSSIYVLPNGKNVTNWQGFTFSFRRKTRRFIASEYRQNGQDKLMSNVLITGAASGIGKAAAQVLYEQGWSVGLLDLDEHKLREISQHWQSERTHVYAVDITNTQTFQAAIDDFATRHDGHLRLLFNCAGVMQIIDSEKMSSADFSHTFAVNVHGLFNACKIAFPYLKQTQDAQIINMNSAATQYGVPWQAGYSASKFAVKGLTEALNLEWEKYGIHVGSIVPPVINTPMVTEQTQQSPIMERLAGRQKLSPQDVVNVILHQIDKPKLHRPVGLKFTLLYHLADWTPIWLTRLIFRHILMR